MVDSGASPKPLSADERPHLLDTWHDDGTCYLCGDEWPCNPALQAQVDELTREREAVEQVLTRWEGPLPEPRTTMPAMFIDAGIRTGIEECAKELRAARAAASEQGETRL